MQGTISKDFNLREMQLMLVDMLKSTDYICKKHNIRYYLIGGSTLGAVRHNGFIPWDDDIDIAMPRKDYERFLKIAPQELPQYYEIRTYKTHPEGHVYHWAKIEDNRTTLIVDWLKHLNYAGGIFIDLFPLDGVSKYQFIRKLHFKLLFLFSKKMFYIIYRDPTIKSKLFRSPKIINMMQRSKTRRLLHKIIHNLITPYNYDKSKYVANYTGEWLMKEIMLKEYFGTPQLFQFENHLFNIPEKYDPYLKKLYGDYMKLPPKEKQISLHEFYLVDLNSPNSTMFNS